MSSGGKGKIRNIVSFIKEHFDIVGNSILALALLGLEKLMDLEFQCPEDKILAIVYSLVFFFVPTVIIGVVAYYLSSEGMCCKAGNRQDDTENKAITEEGDWGKKCRRCCKHHMIWMKPVLFWMIIVFTDGRYLSCCVKSVDELKGIYNSAIDYKELLLSWAEVKENYLIQMFQIIGLLVILVVMVAIALCESKVFSILLCFGCNLKKESESNSERYKRMNKDILLQITEDTIQEEARKRQKEFVVALVSRENWAFYNPGQPNAMEVLEKIQNNCKKEVRKQLQIVE